MYIYISWSPSISGQLEAPFVCFTIQSRVDKSPLSPVWVNVRLSEAFYRNVSNGQISLTIIYIVYFPVTMENRTKSLPLLRSIMLVMSDPLIKFGKHLGATG